MPQTLTYTIQSLADQSHLHNDVKIAIVTTHQITGGSFFLCDATTGSFAITLPDATLWENRMISIVKITAANTLTVDTLLSQTINGVTSQAYTTQWTGLTVVSDGTNWIIEP
jgi:hypothetical protein